MGLANLFVHDVTLLRAEPTTDANGFTIKGDTVETAVRGWVTQQSSTEVVDGREAQVSSWVAFLPADVDVVGVDRVTWSGVTFEVDGAPRRAWTPRGEHHVEVPLKVVDG
jgi:hypothetical protein